MRREELVAQIYRKKSFLCVGLDTDLSRIPKHLLREERPVMAFNKAIIEATRDLCVAYKVNTAFYEARGLEGWQDLKDTFRLLPKDSLAIADAKRADIGNTSAQYARAFFEQLGVDALTLAPYMGQDSLAPFLAYKDKWSIVLALTSNAGSQDFQMLNVAGKGPLYRQVLLRAAGWAGPDQLMFVIGATHPDKLAEIRQLLPQHFFLVPGVGVQGGRLEAVAQAAMTSDVGLLINSSRGIIYATEGEDFAEQARMAAQELQKQCAAML